MALFLFPPLPCFVLKRFVLWISLRMNVSMTLEKKNIYIYNLLEMDIWLHVWIDGAQEVWTNGQSNRQNMHFIVKLYLNSSTARFFMIFLWREWLKKWTQGSSDLCESYFVLFCKENLTHQHQSLITKSNFLFS